MKAPTPPTSPTAASSATIEREIKLRDTDHQEVVRALAASGAEPRSEACWERNWVLDDKQNTLRAGARLLRVRECLDRDGAVTSATLTAKAPAPDALMEAGAAEGVKVRVEHETQVHSASETIALLALLGLVPARRYDKVRATWRLGLHEVVLDHTPMGDFVEIEGPAPAAVAQELGLSLEKADLRNYLAIFDEHVVLSGVTRTGAQAPMDMLFEGGSPPGFPNKMDKSQEVVA